jgi:hypothetical protein
MDYDYAEPCPCRTERIASARARRAKADEGTPMTAKTANGAVRALRVLAFFPSEGEARAMVASALLRMCHTAEQCRYVVKKACDLYRKWDDCGIPGLRQILCSLTIPRDGLVQLSTEAYPDGIPLPQGAGLTMLPNAPWQPAQLPPGRLVSAAADVDGMVVHVATECARLPLQLVPKPAPKPPEPLSDERRAELAAQLEHAKEQYERQKLLRAAGG